MTELHLTKKDFKVEWFSGSGAGGQHRNKHQNCCRITHIESGLRAQATEHRERSANQRAAFTRLARLLIARYCHEGAPERYRATAELVRNYHGVRNEVHDKASGKRLPYRQVVVNGDLGELIEARRSCFSASLIGRDES